MTPALENRIRDAIRDELEAGLFRHDIDADLNWLAQATKCTPAEARAVWDKHFAITEAN